MSLFGTVSPEDAQSTNSPPRSRNDLFEDDPNTRPSHDSLFDDEAPSPWDIPTHKERNRIELLRNLLPTTDVPDLYIDYFEAISEDDGAGQPLVSADKLSRILIPSKLDADDQAKILAIIAPDGIEGDITLNQDEFNVFLALIGLAQEGEIIGLDGIDERRNSKYSLTIPFSHPHFTLLWVGLHLLFPLRARVSFMARYKLTSFPDLPRAKIPGLVTAVPTVPTSSTKTPGDSNANRSISVPTTSSPPLSTSKVSINYTPDDPWNTPEVHKNHHHASVVSNDISLPKPISGLGDGTLEASSMRTTSNFTTSASTIVDIGADGQQQNTHAGAEEQGSSSAWGIYGSTAVSGNVFAGAGAASNGLNDDNSDLEHLSTVQQTARTIGSGRTGGAVEENIIVALMPEKEGFFLFKHHNYEVTSTRRVSKVIRRYSDFVWLLECLHKRYPFRVLPLLPPKIVAGMFHFSRNRGKEDLLA